MTDNRYTDKTLEALDKLTQPWRHMFGPRHLGPNNYKTVEYDPLLDSLREAISSSIGKTAAGASADNARNQLNVAAFELWELIDGIVRAWAYELKVDKGAELKQTLRRVYVAVNRLRADERGPFGFDRTVRGWVSEINNLFDPPTTKELIADCPAPKCGQRYWVNENGEIVASLIAYYRTDEQPEAKCRSCGTTWQGERELLELGYSIGATADEDALREMGVQL